MPSLRRLLPLLQSYMRCSPVPTCAGWIVLALLHNESLNECILFHDNLDSVFFMQQHQLLSLLDESTVNLA